MQTFVPRNPFRMPKTKTMKVGSRVTSSSLKADITKRLGIMVEGTEAPLKEFGLGSTSMGL